MREHIARMAKGRFHVALGVSLFVGALLMMVDSRISVLTPLPFILVPLALGLYVLLHRSATSGRSGPHVRH